MHLLQRYAASLCVLFIGACGGDTSGVGPATTTSSSTAAVDMRRGNDELTFAVIGDYGIRSSGEAAVASLVKGWNPEVIITTGDNNYPLGEAATIDANIGQYYREFIYPYGGAYGPGASVNRFFPALGNHDWSPLVGAQPYLAYFHLPNNGRYYDFRAGPVHFFCLDSDPHEPDGVTDDSLQAAWLQERLKASDAAWKVVYMHHPPYSSRSGGIKDLRWPYKAWGADLVVSGHNHLYERLERKGLTYVINGLGGAPIAAFEKAPLKESLVRYNLMFGAMRGTATEERLSVEMVNQAGLAIDSFSLDR